MNRYMAFVFPAYLLIFITSSEATINSISEIEDPDELLPRIRMVRDYDIGGPVARVTKKPGPSQGSSTDDIIVPPTTPKGAPASAGKPAPASTPSAAAPASGQGQGQGSSASMNKQGSNQSASAINGHSAGGGNGTGKLTGGSRQEGGLMVNGCRMTVVPNGVLTDISLGNAQLPDYNFKFTDNCKISECAKICEKAQCNYFMRSNSNGLTYFYTIKADKLQPAIFTQSVFYDSFIPQCTPGGNLENGQSLRKPIKMENSKSRAPMINKPPRMMNQLFSSQQFPGLEIVPRNGLSAEKRRTASNGGWASLLGPSQEAVPRIVGQPQAIVPSLESSFPTVPPRMSISPEIHGPVPPPQSTNVNIPSFVPNTLNIPSPAIPSTSPITPGIPPPMSISPDFTAPMPIPSDFTPPMPISPDFTPPMPIPSDILDRCPECSVRDLFKQYLQQQNKTYDPYEEESRFDTFRKALNRIRELNSKPRQPGDAVFGPTKFTDVQFPEFVKKFTGGIQESVPANVSEEDLSSIANSLPVKFDWRTESVVPDVRYQKDCGSCYAFSTSDLVATQWAIDHDENRKYVLSPQYVLDCTHAPAAFGCDGGRPYLVLATNANCSGPACAWPRESCYPYQNQAGDVCKVPNSECTKQDTPAIQVRKAYYLDVSHGNGTSEKLRISALLQGGPVVGLVTVTDHWQYYINGTMRASQCPDKSIQPNHAVLIVGYDYTNPNQSYYIIKNTWDTDWGENGYFRLEAGSNTCGIGQFLSYACTSADCPENILGRVTRRLDIVPTITVPNLYSSEIPTITPPTTKGYSATPLPEGIEFGAKKDTEIDEDDMDKESDN